MSVTTVEQGAAIGPYRILESLGAGGAGIVYRARHLESGELAAVKTVRVPDPRALRGIRREIHALRRLRHPGIVAVRAEGLDRGIPWYAMELVEGETLRGRIDASFRDHPGVVAGGDLSGALTLARRLCDALAFLHGEGLVHRDLKPENVVVRPDGWPVVVDLGLVSAFGGGRGRETLDAAGTFDGSFGYMAPEQISGDPVDARADLYALGCILHELLTGRPVFLGEGWELVRQHLASAPARPSTWAGDLPPALDDLVLRLLAKRPRDRVGYADDVAAVLEQLEEQGGAGASVPSRAYLYRPELAGRSALVEELEAMLDAAKLGQGRFVLLRGESGAGKTRLAIEIATAANRRGFRVVTGECAPLEASPTQETSVFGPPLHPLRPLLQAIGDECRARGARATEAILRADGAILGVHEPSLAALSGRGAAAEPSPLSPQEARQRAVEAFARTVGAFAADHPLLLVLDDMQWADDLTLEALTALLRGPLERLPLLVIGTYRTEEEREALRRLSSARGVHGRALDRLDEGAVESIVGDMLALPQPPRPFVQYLAAQSSGNPFFVAEYLRAAVGDGLLGRDRQGRWQVSARAHALDRLQEALPFPASLRLLLGRWLAALPPGTRQLVEAAAVLGREFEGDLLAADDPGDDLGLLEVLEELRTRNVLEEASQGRLRFTHDKLREIVYEGIPEPARRSLHRAAAERIGAKSGDDPAFYAALAHHWLMAEVDEKSFDHLELAGGHALGVGASGAAADFFQRALGLLERRGAAAAIHVGPERKASWRRSLGDSWFGLGDIARSREAMEGALADLGMPLPTSPRGWSTLLLRQMITQGAHLTRSRRAVERGEGARSRLMTGARAASRLCECYYYRQDFLGVTTAAVLAVNLAEHAGCQDEVRRQYAQLGYMAGLLRLHPLARRYFRGNHEEGAASPDPSGLGVALYYESSYEATFCNWARASRLADESIARLSEAGDQHELQIARTMRAHVDYYAGRFEATLPLLAAVRSAAKLRGNGQLEAWGAYATARSLIPLGRLDEAVTLLGEAKELLEGHADRSSHIICNGLLAVARLYRGELDEAVRAADTVSELAAGGQPAALTEGRGYEGAAIVYLALWERRIGSRRAGPDVARRARSLCTVLFRFGQSFPLSSSAGLRCLALAEALSGRPRVARWMLKRALDAAREQEMPYDEALAGLELARAAPPGSPAREGYREAARERLSALGCTHHLDALVTLA